MRVSDFIAKRLKFLGCNDVYMVTGGAAMHLNDSFGSTYGDTLHFLHHEQSCSMAAESYARITGKPAVLNVTAGPGGINAINGVFGAFVDSLPLIVISGQAKRETLVKNSGRPKLRQLGDQEVDIVSMVKKICKKSILIEDPYLIEKYLNELFISTTSNRPGPVWLDVPIDIQAFPLPIEFEKLITSPIHEEIQNRIKKRNCVSEEELDQLGKKIIQSTKPVFYVGSGIRISGAYKQFLQFLEEFPIATVTGWNSNDLLWDDHPSYSGRPGSVGNRAGNFAVQLADCVITIGCRLNIRQVSFNWDSFAKDAWQCHIDIDRDELEKPTLNTDLKIEADILDFFPRLSQKLKDLTKDNKVKKSLSFSNKWKIWRALNKDLLNQFPAIEPCKKINNKLINPYFFIDQLFKKLKENDIIVCADGTACVVAFQGAIIKKGQRLYHNSGCASMGYELPAAIGAFDATNREIICIAGDGSIMMNLQELATIGGKKIPIKIFLLNNNGYHSIRQTQRNYFPNNPIGCGSESGLHFPKFKELMKGFKIDYIISNKEDDVAKNIELTLKNKGPILHEIVLNLDQPFEPKLSSKKLNDGTMSTSKLEDMAPFIDNKLMEEIKEKAASINQ
tara:strand:+ start:1495 stop:3351 length:1857 start_codon:yes stop_codon:yes gene_type:complete